MSKKPNDKLNLTYLDGLAVRYDTLRSEIKESTSEKDKLSGEMKEIVLKHGDLTDEKGSRMVDTDHYRVERTVRDKSSLNTEKAVELLRKKGLTKALVTTTVVTVDQAALEQLVLNEKISPEELKSITVPKEEYAVYVTPLKEVKHA